MKTSSPSAISKGTAPATVTYLQTSGITPSAIAVYVITVIKKKKGLEPLLQSQAFNNRIKS